MLKQCRLYRGVLEKEICKICQDILQVTKHPPASLNLADAPSSTLPVPSTRSPLRQKWECL
eukprot:1346218-Amorphochlora_amoeboformis.AAC.1